MPGNTATIERMKSITHSALTLATAAALIGVGATGAFFSDTETSSGGTFAAGVIDLMVGNESYYNGNVCTDVDPGPGEDFRWQGATEYPEPDTPCVVSWADTTKSLVGKLFFAFADLKPDDEGEDTISLTVDTNDAWACMEVSLTSDDDVSSVEPELDAGDLSEDTENMWDGELARVLQFIWWADDGDNVLESDEYPTRVLSDGVQTLHDLATSTGSFQLALADSVTNVWTGTAGPLLAGETYHIGKAWCFGTLTPAPVLAGQGVNPSVASGIACDGTMIPDVNSIQTDGTTLDVSFIAHQARHDSAYRCPDPYEPPVSCEIVQTYADEVVFVDQGLLRDGINAVTLGRSDTNKVLGAPQSLGTPYDDTTNPTILNGFFSLGFPLGGNTAEIILSFNDNYVVNGPGMDLKLWEVTGGTKYPEERVDVYVGNTPTGPWTQVGFGVSRDAEVDLGAVVAARYVRVVDASYLTDFPLPTYADADGFDLDAVQALNCIVSPAR